MTGGFPSQRASHAENRFHVITSSCKKLKHLSRLVDNMGISLKVKAIVYVLFCRFPTISKLYKDIL